MNRKFAAIALLAGVVSAAPLGAAPLTNGVERLSYAWRLKGGLSWLVKVAFPASGRGTLETHEAGNVHSQLTIQGKEASSFYLYESLMAPEGTRTLSSRNAYSFGDDRRDERISFDPVNQVAHVQKFTSDGNETKLKKLESAAPQDVLTSIYYLRQHADEIRTPKKAEIFSGTSGYDVIYVPQPAMTMRIGGSDVRVRPFTIKPVDGDKAKIGEVRVWLTDDAKHVPVRIDIDQKYATLKLELEK
jgi:Protein of unknown function (DUF3108)